jgi:hypothetical protein
MELAELPFDFGEGRSRVDAARDAESDLIGGSEALVAQALNFGESGAGDISLESDVGSAMAKALTPGCRCKFSLPPTWPPTNCIPR